MDCMLAFKTVIVITSMKQGSMAITRRVMSSCDRAKDGTTIATSFEN
jgi:hypothetical protein